MIINKLYEGLKRIANGDYVLDGDLRSDETIEIDLDDRFVIRGNIESKKSIIVKLGITAGDGITADWGITAGAGITAKTFIDSGKRIFAGTSVYRDSKNCDKTIRCAELRSGEIAFGDLVIEKPEPQLLPCPFCGNEKLFVGTSDEIHEDGQESVFSVCCDYNQGGCGVSNGIYKTKEEAIEKWNKRT